QPSPGRLLQSPKPALQLKVHFDATHPVPLAFGGLAQLFPQLPQLLESLVRSAHLPLQQVWLMQATLHPPQFFLSLSFATQTPLQQIREPPPQSKSCLQEHWPASTKQVPASPQPWF